MKPDFEEVSVRRIIYCSQAMKDFSTEELVALLSTARACNTVTGLSGMLLYSKQSFLQVLEGEETSLRRTYARIMADRRHVNLRPLLDTAVTAPLFPDWTMGFEQVDDAALAENLEGFTPATVYPLVDPDLVANATVAETLLKLYARNRPGVIASTPHAPRAELVNARS